MAKVPNSLLRKKSFRSTKKILKNYLTVQGVTLSPTRPPRNVREYLVSLRKFIQGFLSAESCIGPKTSPEQKEWIQKHYGIKELDVT